MSAFEKLFVKDDLQDCREILLDNSNIVDTLFMETLATSEKYPQVDYKSFERLAGSFRTTEPIPSTTIESSFVRATGDDAENGLAGSLCLGRFYEAILRLVHSVKPENPSANAEQLEDFIQ